MLNFKAVILTQTISFYNLNEVAMKIVQNFCCHTYPNDKLLQQYPGITHVKRYEVVIPIQTISFYNPSDNYQEDLKKELSYLSKR